MKRTATASAAISAMILIGCVQSQPSDTPTASEPQLEQMHVARAAGKISVPVDVRYLASGEPVAQQAMTLQLAFVPRIEGENLRVEFPPSDSATIDSGNVPMVQQKASPTGVIRRNLVVTPHKSEAAEVRVLVSMDAEGGRYFGVFTIPLD